MSGLTARFALRCWVLSVALVSAPVCTCWSTAGEEPDEFFERSVRPLLSARCFGCHRKGDKSGGGLEMISRERLLAGGDRGPAVVPGDPDGSLLLQAVRHEGELKMPPDRALAKAEIDMLATWIRSGAPWPESVLAAGAASPDAAADWAFQPVRDHAVPAVEQAQWPQSPVDNFVLHRLEQQGLAPNTPADRLTWLRRVTFDLTGLPPTRAECESFEQDSAPGADARVVERLLASRQYAERWARHWLDLVRYAETNGFEDDTEKPNAFRYRNYVIDAFHDDLPYDQFLKEHIAGDLLPTPRRSADGLRIESPVGSGFWWLGEIFPLPFCQADLRVVSANEIESQVDTYSKAFLGLTISCARCHDHKFDPITSRDYYSIAGTLASSTNVQACIETAERYEALEAYQAEVDKIDAQIAARLGTPDMQARIAAARQAEGHRVADYVLAAMQRARNPHVPTPASLQASRVERWMLSLQSRHPVMSPLSRLGSAPAEVVDRRADFLHGLYNEMNQALPRWRPEQVLGDFENGYGDWVPTGHAFGSRPASRSSGNLSGVVGNSYASSFRGSDALTGRLVSPKFKVTRENRYLIFAMCGGDYAGKTCVNLVLHSQAMPQLPPFWSLTSTRSRDLTFTFFDLHFYEGMELFVEVVDDHVGEWGHIDVDHFYFASGIPPTEYFFVNPLVVRAVEGIKSTAQLAQRLQELVLQALARSDADLPSAETPHWNALREWLLRADSPLLSQADIEALLDPADQEFVAQLRARRAQLITDYPTSSIAMVSQDRAVVSDARIQLSASVENLGDAVSRGRPIDLAKRTDAVAGSSSGRLDLAEWTASPENPFTARVLVNRLWKHHFGRGIVGSPDNFGAMGERPSHPELLDFLAKRFIESGWSIKALHRLMVLSSTYRQSSRPTPESLASDPSNRWLHHIPIRRLEAECIRDTVLATTGTLNLAPLETSVPLVVKDRHMLDSVETPGLAEHERYRSIYLQAFRNFAPTLFEAFDYPRLPVTTGQRTESSVPGQALVMLNSDFLAISARRWAVRLADETPTAQARIESIYWSAFSRPPRPSEVAIAREFVDAQQAQHVAAGSHSSDAELAAWADYCHVVLNLSELIVVR